MFELKMNRSQIEIKYVVDIHNGFEFTHTENIVDVFLPPAPNAKIAYEALQWLCRHLLHVVKDKEEYDYITHTLELIAKYYINISGINSSVDRMLSAVCAVQKNVLIDIHTQNIFGRERLILRKGGRRGSKRRGCLIRHKFINLI